MSVIAVLLSKESVILHSLLDSKVPIKYNCLQGHCRMCKATLLNGEVVWVNPQPTDLAKNQILTCSCLASTDLKIKL